MRRQVGIVDRVHGPVVEARECQSGMMMELVHVGEAGLVGEIIKLSGNRGVIQVYEDTTGLAPGQPVYGTGMPLSVQLGPGLLGRIYDGIQRPLVDLKERMGTFISRGEQIPALNGDALFSFTPITTLDERVSGGTVIGTVPEGERMIHRIMVPPGLSGKILFIADAGSYRAADEIALLEDDTGRKHSLTMIQHWPIRQARPVRRRLQLSRPLVTGQRVIDTLFPLAKGGTVAIPGGFGTGKTMTQHAVAKWCDADVIIYIGCGERGNEMTDVLREFPLLVDPRSGTSLMDRTILIANTSNMPVSAREASIYTGASLAEYYRDQGYHVAVMADSTSRWAEALRELSGRMEEMPAEEGFPAYLPTRIAQFYERAGAMETLSGYEGSVSIIGAVSPPGGDFSEPVTQHTKRFVRCFWALDRQLANARHYPAIGWLESYSEYIDDLEAYWKEQGQGGWISHRRTILDLLQREVRLLQVVKLVGPDALPDSQRFILEVCSLFKRAFLQQDAFDEVDRFTSIEKQANMLKLLLQYWDMGSRAISRGATVIQLRRMKVVQELMKMKFRSDDNWDSLEGKLQRAFDRLELLYEES